MNGDADVREKMNLKEILRGATFVFYFHVAKQDGSRIVRAVVDWAEVFEQVRRWNDG